jgi:predicted Zn-ribbon and HTH transcriptional regulator
MTVRDRIRAALERGDHTSLQLSQAVGVPQGEVAGHLEHLSRSLPHQGLALVVEPARCIACGFAFEDRRRMSRPSRCPRCRSERIDPPRFSIRARP